MDIKKQQQSISEGRKTKSDLAKEVALDKTKLKQIDKASHDSDDPTQEKQKLTKKKQLQSSLKENESKYELQVTDINEKLQQLNKFTPKELVEQLSDNYPFLLFPVRVETKFKTVDNGKELWIRIYPDDISIHTHEELLTKTEYESGKKYWTTIWNVTDETIKQGAWNTVVNAFGANRSAWVIRQTKPSNWPDSLPDKSALVFPVAELKLGSWAESPHVKIMPDRFVVTGYSAGKTVFEKIGNVIPDDLQVAPNLWSDETPFSKDESTGEITVTENLKWLVNFSKAEEIGMAVRIPLDEPYATEGLERILVLGLRISSDEEEGTELIEELIRNHHYSANGFSFVRQGTPTNNTDDDSSGYSSSDFANETSYEVETGDPLFTVNSNDLEKTDAQRFSEALGINYDPVYQITNADSNDVAEAKLMNTCLWPGTLGYYMDEMMYPVFSADQISFTRDFFTQYVTGRGPLPVIRVGTQPYGILPTSYFSDWKWSENETGNDYTNFNNLYNILDGIQKSWSGLVDEVSYYDKSGDAYETLLKMLGLQAGSVEFYQRIGTDDSVTWNYLYWQNPDINYPEYYKLITTLSDAELEAVGLDPSNPPKIASVNFFDSQTRLTGSLIDENPLSETDPILPYDETDTKEGTNNYIGWLQTSNSDTITTETFKDLDGNVVSPPAALLYLMLRNAYLQEVWQNVQTFYMVNGLITESVKEKSIVNVKASPEMTKMDYMMADVSKLSSSLRSEKSVLVADFVQQSNLFTKSSEFLNSIKSALDKLKDLPTARLERVFTEHLDTCAYRLDAWQTGMFTRRLEYLRTGTGEKGGTYLKKGTYIGAFGWLEDIKPDTTTLKEVNWEEIPEELREEKKGKVYEDTSNGGFIHGYSLNHALTGAVLRNAYLSHADDSLANTFSVNLSSERVRMSQYYLDGVRNGQSLSSLLGYQFERGLHDNNASISLDQYIYFFREKYPLLNSELSKLSTASSIAASNVVDGYALFNASISVEYPYNISGLPAAGSEEGIIIKAEVDKLADVMDAISDLALAESVYQIIQGNYTRGGAVTKAFSEGKNPPEAQIAKTPRKGKAITNRLCLNFEIDPSDNLWNTSPSPRSTMEKGLNKWLGSLIGDPEKIRCVVSYTVTGTDGTVETIYSIVKLSELNLQPIDFVLMTDKTFGKGSSELEKRIAYLFRRNNSLSDSAIIELLFKTRDTGWDETVKTFYEIIPFIKNLRQIITMCRPLQALDFMLPSESQETVNANMKGYNTDDIKNSSLTGRLDKIYSALEKLNGELSAALSAIAEPFTSSSFDTLREKLKLVAGFGISEAFPVSASGYTADEYALLKTQTDSIASVIEQRLLDANVLLNYSPAEGDLSDTPTELELMQDEGRKKEELISSYSEAARLLLGSSFSLIPKFSLNNPSNILKAVNNRNNLIRYSTGDLGNPFIVDDWIQGAAKVRKRVSDVDEVMMYNQNFNAAYLSFTPIQLPYDVQDHWVSVEFPETMTIDRDFVSIVTRLPSPYDPAAQQSGLLIDDWTELIPQKSETTGIAFHYDQPNAMAPQALLLAVTPQIKGKWTWDDLMNILKDTLDRSKRRAVEPDQIDNSSYAHFLPAILAAFSRQPVTISTYLGKNNPGYNIK